MEVFRREEILPFLFSVIIANYLSEISDIKTKILCKTNENRMETEKMFDISASVM